MRITLCQILEPERHVLFGEWLFAKHSKHYTSLPAYFIAFDIYDKVRGRGETEMVRRRDKYDETRSWEH